MYHVHLQEWGWKTWYCSDCSVSISGSGSGGPFFAESNFGTATDLEPWSPGTLQPPVGLQSWVNGRLLVDGDFTIKATSSHGDLTVSWISGSIVFSTVLSFSKSNITWNCCFNNICITLKYVFFLCWKDWSMGQNFGSLFSPDELVILNVIRGGTRSQPGSAARLDSMEDVGTMLGPSQNLPLRNRAFEHGSSCQGGPISKGVPRNFTNWSWPFCDFLQDPSLSGGQDEPVTEKAEELLSPETELGVHLSNLSGKIMINQWGSPF